MLTIRHWKACVGGLTLMMLAACGSDGSSSTPTSAGSGPPSTTTASEKVVVTPSVSGTVTGTSGASQTLSIAFNASESGSLSNLTVTGFDSLPAGWSAASAFSCSTVGTGNGCTLSLTFKPVGASTGTLSLRYTYTDNNGVTQTGSVDVPYSSSNVSDNIVVTTSPSGQVAAIIGGSQSVAVTFNTDDGNAASAFTVSSDLTALPAGWSSAATSFNCATVSTGNGCQFQLTYAPQAAGNGILTLNFNYLDNSGVAKSGTVSIPYAATANNNVTGTASPTGQVNTFVGGGGQNVTVTFITDDPNAATALSASSSLSALPTDWSSSSSSFACATVAPSGTGCQLTLNFNPTAAESGTVQLAYSYQSSAGVAKTGSVSIPYAATAPHAYISDPNYKPLICSVNGDGTLSNCTFMSASGSAPAGNNDDIAVSGNYAYVTNSNNNDILVCTLDSNSALSTCVQSGSGMASPTSLFIRGSYLYVTNFSGSPGVTMCTISSSDGTLSNCTGTGPSGQTWGIAFAGNYAYLGSGRWNQSGAISVCSVDSTTGLLSNCAASAQSAEAWVTAANGYLYAPQASTVHVCPITTNGAVSTCTNSIIDSSAGLTEVSSVTVSGSHAYVIAANTQSSFPPMRPTFNVYLCTVSASDGSLSSCVATNGGQSNPYFWFHLVLH
jgi:hypothetical protein